MIAWYKYPDGAAFISRVLRDAPFGRSSEPDWEMSWVISVSCDSVLLADKAGATTCGLKSPARSIGATSWPTQARCGPGNGRRSRRCCRRQSGEAGRGNGGCG